jgi:pimeloyl-ACP methyl ester carboxylesterase
VPELCASDHDRALFAPGAPSLASVARVAVFDQRGTGASRQVAPATSARQLADDALSVGRALLGERFAVIGASMGGWAALHAVLSAPDSVSSLGLISTTAGGRGLTPPSDAVIHNTIAVAAHPDEDLVREGVVLAFAPAFAATHGPLMDLLVTETLATPSTEADLIAQGSVFASHDVTDQLDRINVATLVMCGTNDVHHPPANSELLADRIPGARLVLVDGAAHALGWEAPERLVTELLVLLRHGKGNEV